MTGAFFGRLRGSRVSGAKTAGPTALWTAITGIGYNLRAGHSCGVACVFTAIAAAIGELPPGAAIVHTHGTQPCFVYARINDRLFLRRIAAYRQQDAESYKAGCEPELTFGHMRFDQSIYSAVHPVLTSRVHRPCLISAGSESCKTRSGPWPSLLRPPALPPCA